MVSIQRMGAKALSREKDKGRVAFDPTVWMLHSLDLGWSKFTNKKVHQPTKPLLVPSASWFKHLCFPCFLFSTTSSTTSSTTVRIARMAYASTQSSIIEAVVWRRISSAPGNKIGWPGGNRIEPSISHLILVHSIL